MHYDIYNLWIIMYSTFQHWSNLDVFLCAQDCDGFELHSAWYLAANFILYKSEVTMNQRNYFAVLLPVFWQTEMTHEQQDFHRWWAQQARQEKILMSQNMSATGLY